MKDACICGSLDNVKSVLIRRPVKYGHPYPYAKAPQNMCSNCRRNQAGRFKIFEKPPTHQELKDSDDVKRFKQILPAQMEAFKQAAKL